MEFTLDRRIVYADDLEVFRWLRAGAPDRQKCLEAQVMDLADDIAYSVHDIEDGIVAGRIDLAALEDPGLRADVWATVAEWYLPEVDPAALDDWRLPRHLRDPQLGRGVLRHQRQGERLRPPRRARDRRPGPA